MAARRVYGFLHDEQGNRSMSRLLLAITIPFAFMVIAVDVVTQATVQAEAYALLGSLLIAEIAWAGGSNIARYVGPQIAGIAQGIAAAAGARGVATTTTTTVSPGAVVPVAASTPAGPEDPPHEWAEGEPNEGVL